MVVHAVAGRDGASKARANLHAMTRPQATTVPAPAAPSELVAEGLVKRYGRQKVVDGVNLSVKPGEIVALLGPNGAGKTTSFYMMVGFTRPTAGKIRLGQQDVTRWPMHRRAKSGVGYLAQEPSAFRRMTVLDNLLAILEFHEPSKERRKKRATSLLDEFGLTKLADHRASTLSGGERRRLEIARSLTIDPTYILLDEPFTGVDPKSIREIQLLIQDLRDQRGLGVLLTDHSVRETVAIADRIVLMYEGQVRFQGSPDAFAEDDDVRRTYLGTDFQL